MKGGSSLSAILVDLKNGEVTEYWCLGREWAKFKFIGTDYRTQFNCYWVQIQDFVQDLDVAQVQRPGSAHYYVAGVSAGPNAKQPEPYISINLRDFVKTHIILANLRRLSRLRAASKIQSLGSQPGEPGQVGKFHVLIRF